MARKANHSREIAWGALGLACLLLVLGWLRTCSPTPFYNRPITLTNASPVRLTGVRLCTGKGSGKALTLDPGQTIQAPWPPLEGDSELCVEHPREGRSFFKDCGYVDSTDVDVRVRFSGPNGENVDCSMRY
ncbi:MAG: hypothetical protein ACHREM_07695 [Polyangiales bacterium]